MRYEVVGPFDAHGTHVAELRRSIAAAGLGGVVRLRGYQPAGSFERLTESADIFITLRRPNLEGGSASLMGQLPRGRPVVVYDSGCFAEMPDDCVVKTAPGAPLHAALSELVADAQLRARVGARARAYAESCGVETYVASLLEFCERAGRTRALCTLADRAGRELAQISGGAPAASSVDRISRALQDLGPGGGGGDPAISSRRSPRSGL